MFKQLEISCKAPSRPWPKKVIALEYFLTRSLVQLEAFSLYGETCLHTTVSDLSNRHGLVFDRRRESHGHQNGGTTYFTRYSLKEESREAAINLLNYYLRKIAA